MLFKLALTIVIVVLIYNRFFGTSQEKEQSKKIFGEMRNLVVSVTGLVRSEREKFDAGKYDTALDKLGQAYRAVRDRAKFVDENVIDRLGQLERRRAELERQLDELERREAQPVPTTTPDKKGSKQRQDDLQAAKNADLAKRKETLQRELDKLVRDSDALLKEAQEQQE
jgi:nucleoside-triphosphatase THEP1